MKAHLKILLLSLWTIGSVVVLADKPPGYVNLGPAEKLFYDTFLAPEALHAVPENTLALLSFSQSPWGTINPFAGLDDSSYARLVKVHPKLAEMVKQGRDHRVQFFDHVVAESEQLLFKDRQLDRRVNERVRDSYLDLLKVVRAKPQGKPDMVLATQAAHARTAKFFQYSPGVPESSWDPLARRMKNVLVDYVKSEFLKPQDQNVLPEAVLNVWREAEVARLKKQLERSLGEVETNEEFRMKYETQVCFDKGGDIEDAIALLQSLNGKNQSAKLDQLEKQVAAENKRQYQTEKHFFGDSDRIGENAKTPTVKWMWDLNWWGSKQKSSERFSSEYWEERSRKAPRLTSGNGTSPIPWRSTTSQPAPSRERQGTRMNDDHEIKNNERGGNVPDPYRLEPVRADTAGLPSLFRTPLAHELREVQGPHGFRPPPGEPEFRLETFRPNQPVENSVAIPTVDGHDVRVDHVSASDPRTGEKKLLREGADYEVLQTKNKNVILRFKGKSPPEVSFGTSYYRTTGAPAGKGLAEIVLTKTEVANLQREAKKLIDAGFIPMGEALRKLADDKAKPVTAGDVARVAVEDHMLNGYLPGEKLKNAFANPYDAYREFRNGEGEFCATCLPRRDLLKGLLERTLTEHPDVEIKTGMGYTRPPNELRLKHDQGHTFLYVRNGSDVTVLDATPRRQDPRNPKTSDEISQLSHEELAKLIELLHARSNREKIPAEMGSAYAKELARRQKINERQRARLNEIESARRSLLRSLEASTPKHPDENEQLPHQTARKLADIVEAHVAGEISAEEAIARVRKAAHLAPSESGQPENLGSVLRRARSDIFRRIVNHHELMHLGRVHDLTPVARAGNEYAPYLGSLVLRPVRQLLHVLAPEFDGNETAPEEWSAPLSEKHEDIVKAISATASESCLRGWAVGP